MNIEIKEFSFEIFEFFEGNFFWMDRIRKDGLMVSFID